MKRDLIISFFATPPQAAAKTIARGQNPDGSSCWKNEPVFYTVGKSGNWDLSRLRDLGGGSILTGILSEAMNPFKSKGKIVDEWGRIAVVSFSEGTSGARQLMAKYEDASRIDAFISLDSTAIAKSMPTYDAQGFGWGQYGDFGTIGMDGSTLQVLLHTDITNKNKDVASTSDTAAKIFSYLEEVAAPINAYAQENGTVNPWDFVPGYPLGRLNDGPRFFAGPDAQVQIVQKIGNSFRLRLPSPIAFTPTCKREGVCQGKDPDGTPIMVCEGGVGCAHSACAVDFQGGIYRALLAPRWNNPQQFACAGPGCIRPGKDTVLSGFGAAGGFAGFGADVAQVPTTRALDMAALAAEFERLGLPRWDLINKGLVVGGAALVAGAAAYYALRD